MIWNTQTPITNTENRVQQDDLKHTNTNHKHRKQSSTGWSETHKHQSQTQKIEFNRMIWNTQTPITNTENRVQQDDLKHTNTNHKHRKQSSTGWSETHKHQSQTQKIEFNRMIWNTQTPITNTENRVQQDDLKHTNTNHKHRVQQNHHAKARIVHTTGFVTPIVEYWLQQEIAWSNNYIMSGSSTIELSHSLHASIKNYSKITLEYTSKMERAHQY